MKKNRDFVLCVILRLIGRHFVNADYEEASVLSQRFQETEEVRWQNYDADEKLLDCKMRQLFLEEATKAVPWRRNMKDVYDALELETRCDGNSIAAEHPFFSNSVHGSRSAPNDSTKRKPALSLTEQRSLRSATRRNLRNARTSKAKKYFFVCPTDEENDDFMWSARSTAARFTSLDGAIRASREERRKAEAKQGGGDSHDWNFGNASSALLRSWERHVIVLCNDIHFLNETVVLTPKDSYMTFRSSGRGNGTAWISGGTFIGSESARWKPATDKPNIWVADLSSSMADQSDITGLFTSNPHQRMTLARYPNANVEDWNAPNRYVRSKSVKEWIFPPFGDPPVFSYFDLSDPGNPTGHVKNDSTMDDYNSWGVGTGGACATVWGDAPSYWCSNVSAGGWAEVDKAAALSGRMNIPRGMIVTDADQDDPVSSVVVERIKSWKDPTGGIVHVSHSQGWSWHMFNISRSEVVSQSKSNTDANGPENTTATLHFDKGGWQGGRNWECTDSNGHMGDCNGEDKKLLGGEWYVEGILEELDAPGEFYYDREKKLLYFYPPKANVCAKDCIDDIANRKECNCIPDLIATNLQTLIRMEGSMENPVRGIRLKGLGFRDAAKTYMEQWSAPSGGDWALHRGGSIHLEGTQDVTIADSYFHRLDGNAVMLSGYCRDTVVERSEFAWIGNGALATWGDTDGYDATGGEQPRFTVIRNNVMKELGLYEKQSSGWGQNKACENIIHGNVMFNLPRAAINFNDGLGGGNVVSGNIIFNACRESGDHGPINSWDRMPFLTSTNGKDPSFTPSPTHTRQNLILANYGASEGFDNDDGSSFYHTYYNVFYSADGFKMDYGGHDSVFASNLVYAMGKHCFGTGSFQGGHQDKFYNNTCMVVGERRNSDNEIGTLWQCDPTIGMNPTGNRYFTHSGNATWKCLPHQDSFTLEGMQAMGFEKDSTLEIIPSVQTIISWAKTILNSPFTAPRG